MALSILYFFGGCKNGFRRVFITTETGAVRFTDDCRKVIQKEFITYRTQKVYSHRLDETIQAGNLIYIQAILLARYIRGESARYEGFQWKRTT